MTPIPKTLSLGLWFNHCYLWTMQKNVLWFSGFLVGLLSPSLCPLTCFLVFKCISESPPEKEMKYKCTHIGNTLHVLLIPQATLVVHSFVLISTFHPWKFFSTHDFFFNWSIVDLQCCVNVYYTAKWFSYTYIYIHSFFYILFLKFLS